MLTRCRSFSVEILVTKSVIHRKFWWQNLSFMEVMSGPNRTLHFHWCKQNAAWILTKWKFTLCGFVDDFWHVWHSFDIVVSFLTSWFHFWHVQVNICSCLLCSFCRSWKKNYDDRNGQSGLRLWGWFIFVIYAGVGVSLLVFLHLDHGWLLEMEISPVLQSWICFNVLSFMVRIHLLSLSSISWKLSDFLVCFLIESRNGNLQPLRIFISDSLMK